MLAHLESERETALLTVARLVEEDDNRKAAVAVGGLRVVESLWSLLHPPERHKPEPEEEFIDPAEIRKPKVKP